MLTTLLYALKRKDLKRGIAALCLGGGNGVALAVERIWSGALAETTTHRSGGRPGTMGSGIAQVFAQAGFDVRLVDAASGALDRARSSIEKSVAKLVEKGRLTATERDGALQRLSTGTNLDLLADSDYVVEAIFEDKQAKQSLFARLDQLTRPDVILASNTSSISITTLGAATNRPDRVLGMHFMNPVPLMSLVELIRGQATSPESMLTAAELCIRLNRRLSKRPTTPASLPTGC